DPTLTPQQTLEKLTWEGAAWRYPEGLPDDVAQSLRHELRLIEKLNYAPYFLTVHSIVRFARAKDILCQGRGSAANSAVCYVLGLTEDLIKMLSSQVWGWSEDGVEDKHVEALNLTLSDRRLRLTLDLARQLMGAPRHLSQHPGGFVLTHDRLDDLVPIEPAAM